MRNGLWNKLLCNNILFIGGCDAGGLYLLSAENESISSAAHLISSNLSNNYSCLVSASRDSTQSVSFAQKFFGFSFGFFSF